MTAIPLITDYLETAQALLAEADELNKGAQFLLAQSRAATSEANERLRQSGQKRELAADLIKRANAAIAQRTT